MSKHPTQVQRTHYNLAVEYVNFLERQAVTIAMRNEEISLETEEDSKLLALTMFVTSGKLQQPI